MYLMAIFGAAGLILLGVLQSIGAFTTEPAKQVQTAAAEVLRYKNFTESVAGWVTANPAYVGTVTWTTIQGAATTPTAYRSATMPASFKAVVNAGSYVVCGELSQPAVAIIVKNMPDESQGVQTPGASGAQYHVLGPSSTNFAAEALKCE